MASSFNAMQHFRCQTRHHLNMAVWLCDAHGIHDHLATVQIFFFNSLFARQTISPTSLNSQLIHLFSHLLIDFQFHVLLHKPFPNWQLFVWLTQKFIN